MFVFSDISNVTIVLSAMSLLVVLVYFCRSVQEAGASHEPARSSTALCHIAHVFVDNLSAALRSLRGYK